MKAVEDAGFEAELCNGSGVHELSIAIQGMAGPSCVNKIEKALEGHTGVLEAVVTLDPPQAEVCAFVCFPRSISTARCEVIFYCFTGKIQEVDFSSFERVGKSGGV